MMSLLACGLIGITIAIAMIILTAALWHCVGAYSNRNLFGIGFIASLVIEITIIIILYFVL